MTPSLRFLRPRQVAEIYNISLKCLAKWRIEGKGPSYRKIGRKLCLYSVEELEQWLEDHRRVTDTD